MTFVLAEFLCSFGVCYILGSFLFITLTLRLNLFSKNDVLSDTILSNGLIAFICVDVMLLTCQAQLTDQNSLADKDNLTTSLINWNDNKFIM